MKKSSSSESLKDPLPGLFVNSTISLEGVVRWLSQAGLTGSEQPPMGCFDWDPFVYLLGHDIDMVQQDVPAMLEAVFTIIDAGEAGQQAKVLKEGAGQLAAAEFDRARLSGIWVDWVARPA